MERYKTKYIIGEVLDNDTQERSKEWDIELAENVTLSLWKKADVYWLSI